jgi:transposase
MRKLILGLQQDWVWLDKRIEMTTSEIKEVSESEPGCQRLMTIPGIGPLISTAKRPSRASVGPLFRSKAAIGQSN